MYVPAKIQNEIINYKILRQRKGLDRLQNSSKIVNLFILSTCYVKLNLKNLNYAPIVIQFNSKKD